MGDPLGVYKMANLKVIKKGKKKPKRTLKADTVINVVIDMSGSMSLITGATIEGFNSYIEKQREIEGNVLVSLMLFDSGYDSRGGPGNYRNSTRIVRPYVAIPLEEVPELTSEVYRPCGGTPLQDAVGSNILETDEILKRVKTKNPDVFNVIITDGGENSSKRFSESDIRAMVEEREGRGWTFVYMGANQDAWRETEKYGFQRGNVMNYVAADVRDGAFAKAAAATTYHRGVSRDLKLSGELVGTYTTNCFFNEAGISEDQPVVGETVSSTTDTSEDPTSES